MAHYPYHVQADPPKAHRRLLVLGMTFLHMPLQLTMYVRRQVNLVTMIQRSLATWRPNVQADPPKAHRRLAITNMIRFFNFSIQMQHMSCHNLFQVSHQTSSQSPAFPRSNASHRLPTRLFSSRRTSRLAGSST